MVRKITEIAEEEFELSKTEFVHSVGQQTVLIQRDGETVAVLTSPEQYETTREAKAERAIKAMWAVREELQLIAPVELLALEKALGSRTSASEDSKKLAVNRSREFGTPLEPEEQPSLRSPRSFPSMQPTSQEALRPYPIRLPPSIIERLLNLKTKFGVLPSRFIRDAIESALNALEGSAS
jgi:PHD/YefM family antitoxin component YafN of YafNO toxin-antitoxin module